MGAKHLSNGMDTNITLPPKVIIRAHTKMIKFSLQHLVQQVIREIINVYEEKAKFATHENL